METQNLWRRRAAKYTSGAIVASLISLGAVSFSLAKKPEIAKQYCSSIQTLAKLERERSGLASKTKLPESTSEIQEDYRRIYQKERELIKEYNTIIGEQKEKINQIESTQGWKDYLNKRGKTAEKGILATMGLVIPFYLASLFCWRKDRNMTEKIEERKK